MRHLPWEDHRLPALDKTLLEVELSCTSSPLCLFAMHLHAGHWREDDEQRVREMSAILNVLRERADTPLLLAGNFNTLSLTLKAMLNGSLSLPAWLFHDNKRTHVDMCTDVNDGRMHHTETSG